MMPTVPIHSLNLKGQIHVDISLHLKQNYQEPALGESFQFTNSKFIEQFTRKYVAEAPSTDTFKNRFDRDCRERNLLSDVDIEYTNVYALSTLLKSKKKYQIFDRFVMIVNVVVMGQLYGVEYLLEDVWECCSILAAFDRYCRNEDWSSII